MNFILIVQISLKFENFDEFYFELMLLCLYFIECAGTQKCPKMPTLCLSERPEGSFYPSEINTLKFNHFHTLLFLCKEKVPIKKRP